MVGAHALLLPPHAIWSMWWVPALLPPPHATCSMRCSAPVAEPATSAKKDRHCFVASVLPAPLSPEMRMDCEARALRSDRYAAFAIAYVCGGCSLLGEGAANAASCVAP